AARSPMPPASASPASRCAVWPARLPHAPAPATRAATDRGRLIRERFFKIEILRGDLRDHRLHSPGVPFQPRFLATGLLATHVEDRLGRPEQLLLPAVVLRGTDPLAAAQLGNVAGLHPRDHDPQLLRSR